MTQRFYAEDWDRELKARPQVPSRDDNICQRSKRNIREFPYQTLCLGCSQTLLTSDWGQWNKHHKNYVYEPQWTNFTNSMEYCA